MTDSSPLSAVEGLILLDLRAAARDAVKLAMMTLIAQGPVEVIEQQRRILGFRRRVAELRRRGSPRTSFPGGSRLLDLVGASGCTMQEFVLRLRRAYGTNLQGFIRQEIWPALLRRGLLVERRQPFLLFFTRTRRDLTPLGEQERKRIEHAIGMARDILDLIDRDPAQAAALASSLGTAILLVPELKGQYRRLAQAMRDRSGDGGGDGGFFPAGDNKAAGDFDAWCLADFDAAVFDAFDTGFDAFDAGFDSAGGGDGGGNGAGNGGGNGGGQ